MNRLVKASLSPQQSVGDLLSFCSPALFWKIYKIRALSQGFHSLYLSFSFDCDTSEDAKVVLEVDQELRNLGVTASYAVPGEILRENERTYQHLVTRGAKFINHGYTTHTIWKKETKQYQSIFFYDELTQAEVKNDILKGHEFLAQFMGEKPKGFRTPHFGTYQAPWELRFLHQTLEELNYLYSSSTVPAQSLWKGPVSLSENLYEIPVTGMASAPREIFDSWSFFCGRNQKHTPENYLAQAEHMQKVAEENNLVGLLNYYADPSQVYGQPYFFKAIETLVKIANPIVLEEVPALVKSSKNLGLFSLGNQIRKEETQDSQ